MTTRSIIQPIIRSIVRPIVGDGDSFDYLITDDATWTSTFALGAATLSGKTIAVAPGNYTAKTISSFSPASTVTIKALNAGSKPVINRLVLSAVNNITVENFEVINTTWASNGSSSSVVSLTGNSSNVTIRRCDIKGNYRGTVADPSFDVTANNYPEYASILPVFASGGALDSLVIQNATVGDLLSDGNYTLNFANYGGVTFSLSPAATMTVSGGQIASTNITNAGASTGTPSTGDGIRSALISWTGQRRMNDWMVRGLNTSGLVLTGTLTIEDCTFDLCHTAMKGDVGNGAAYFIISGCSFDRIYSDYISFGSSVKWTIRDCFGTRPFSRSGDPGDPHTDWIQYLGGSFNKPDVTIERNVFIDGVTRGSVQGVFIQDTATGFNVSNLRVVGNAVIHRGSVHGINVRNPSDAFIYANTICRYDPTNPSNVSPTAIAFDGASILGDNVIGNNIAESIEASSLVIDNSTFANTVLGLNGASIPYVDVFTNHTGTRSTLSDVVAAYAPKVAYAGRGAFGNTSYINHINRTTNLELEPSYVRFTTLTGQTASTSVSSDWSRIIGGPSSGSISISNGEYRFADDASGTNATAWTSTAGTYTREKFLQVRHTTSASGSTDTITTVTLRSSNSYNFVSTTASASSFISVDNGGTAYSSVNVTGLSSETGIRKVVIAMRFRPDALTTNANIFASSSAAAQRLWFVSPTAIRYQFVGSSRSLRPTFTPTTTEQTHIITLDFTQANGTGCYWATIENGVLLNNTPGSGGSFNTASGTATFAANGTGQMFGSDSTIGLFAEGDGGGVLLDGAFSFFWMHWGDASLSIPDIAQSSVRNQWSADLIGANGSGPLGVQPKLYYTGNAAAWNAGIANLGSLASRPLNKGAGTYV